MPRRTRRTPHAATAARSTAAHVRRTPPFTRFSALPNQLSKGKKGMMFYLPSPITTMGGQDKQQ